MADHSDDAGGAFFGIPQSSQREGWNALLVERIRRCAYPQYIWDKLPSGSTGESILRLDCAQPLAVERRGYEITRYRLSDDAMQLVGEWYSWLITGEITPGGLLEWIREGLWQGVR